MTGPRATVPRRALLLGGASLAATALVGCSGDGDATSTRPTGDTTATRAPTTAAPPSDPPPTTGPATAPPASSGPAEFVVRGPGDTQAVALTFHTDGDLELARRLLAVLQAHGAVATSFVIGDWLAANPAMATTLTDAGMELANHTWSHPTFASLPPDQMADEIGRCRDLLDDLTGSPGRLFRPSGTADGSAVPADAVLAAAGDAGYPTVLGWDVDPFDYQDPGAPVGAERVLATVTAGSIVSLHFGHPDTVTALEPILAGLDERGLRTVTASELLARS